MKTDKPVQSALWANINATYLTEDKLRDLSNFKSSGINFKIALWNPHTNGVRYLKALIYNLSASLTDENWEILKRIRNRNLGKPFSITYRGEPVCLDYLQAVYELSFVAEHLSLDGMKILEIGAGYGRTCHAFLSNHDISDYVIIDLPNCLKLSSSYLQKVLEKNQFDKVRFVPIDDLDVLQSDTFDLCINIDSFAEMEPGTVAYYLNIINMTCRTFYVKNPVGKYADPTLSTDRKENEVDLALETGLLQEVLDIHDSDDVNFRVPSFIDTYRPGAEWSCIADSWAPPWSFYWQALYAREGTKAYTTLENSIPKSILKVQQ
ncbi:MAG TPA: putative sugar O-methyltransferase [Syntrophales bacterium]|nr:putative sugar O-methyltransferase [Syntrophales bacterium]